MRFTLFRKLRNQDAAAGSAAPAAAPTPSVPQGAPAPAPAAQGGQPAPVAAPEQGGAPPVQGGAPSPAAGGNGPVDQNWINSLSEQEFDDYMEGRLTPPGEEAKPADGATPEEGKEGEPAVAEPVDLGDGLLPEEIASLPPRVQEAIRAGDEASRLVEQHKSFLNQEFQETLVGILTHPVVQQLIQEQKNGVTVPSFIKEAVTSDAIIDKLLADKAIDGSVLGIDIDNDGVRGEIGKIVDAALQAHNRIYEVKHQLALKEAETINNRQETLGNLWHNLSTSVASLKSEEPIDSDKHPIAPFRNWLLDEHAAGKLSWEFIEENGQNLYATFAAKNAGGVGALAAQPARNLRARLIADMTDTARAAVVTSSSARSAAPVPQAQGQFGVDVARFKADPTYRDQIWNLAESSFNNPMVNYLGRLDRGGN